MAVGALARRRGISVREGAGARGAGAGGYGRCGRGIRSRVVWRRVAAWKRSGSRQTGEGMGAILCGAAAHLPEPAGEQIDTGERRGEGDNDHQPTPPETLSA